MEEIKLTQVGIMSGGKWDKMNDCARRVYDENGLAPTITTMGGGICSLKLWK